MVSEQVKINSERIDDIPVIMEWLKKMEIAKFIDQKLSPPHGNHKGLSYGQLSVLLLTYIITQSDHRLSAVEPWVEAQRKILELSTGWSIGEKDASDDRLARVVEELGKQSEARQEIEVKLGRHLIRAYELPTLVARTDTSSFSVNHQQVDSPEESLLRYGYSKDFRPDLLQYRQLLATLDPMGMPLVSATLAGNGADDPLYFPTFNSSSSAAIAASSIFRFAPGAFLISNKPDSPSVLYFCNHLVTVEVSRAKRFPISCCSFTCPLLIHHNIISFSFWFPKLAVCRRFFSSSSLSAISISKGRLMSIQR
nr:DUF4277 domain-containing protein [Nostoc favosum]